LQTKFKIFPKIDEQSFSQFFYLNLTNNFLQPFSVIKTPMAGNSRGDLKIF